MFIKAFGQVKDVVGSEFRVEERMQNVGSLKEYLAERFPEVSWSSVSVAVNKKFAEEDHPVYPDDEVAIIPPVSGG